MGLFSTEEISLMNVYDSPGRTQLITDIKDSLPYVIYPDEKKLMQTVIDKLEQIADGEYAEIGLFPVFQYYETEV